MKTYTINELAIAINSCATLKEFAKKFKSMYYFIHCNHLLYLFDGVYFYDKPGLVNTCYDLYGDKYDLTEFLKNGTKYSTSSDTILIPVLCKNHGRVLIPLKDLLSGVGCHKCLRDVRNEIKRAFTPKRPHRSVLLRQVHEISNNTVTISSFEEYKNLRGLIKFTCVYHGDFSHKIRSFLNSGGKCPYCLLIDKISLILTANGVSNTIKNGVIYLVGGKSVGINNCDINISLTDNVYDVLSSNGLIYTNNCIEEWLPIDGFSDYLISNLGMIKNLKTGSLLRGHIKNDKRVVVGLNDDDGAPHSLNLHRLVYIAFNGPINDDANIDHIDGNPLNNRLSNLRICKNIKENINNEVTIVSSKVDKYLKYTLSKDPVKHNYDVSSIDGEVWVDVIGQEETYEVSNLGRVRSKVIRVKYSNGNKEWVVSLRPKLIKQHSKYGYLYVSIGVKGNRQSRSVHKMVYESFNGPVSDGLEIDHINRVKTDNRLENLRAVTKQENLKNRYE